MSILPAFAVPAHPTVPAGSACAPASRLHASTRHLVVCFDTDDVFGAIEATLSNARRTGLALHALELPCRRGDNAQWQLRLTVAAHEPDRLDLFVRRVENGFDVVGVAELDADVGAACGAANSTDDDRRTAPVVTLSA